MSERVIRNRFLELCNHLKQKKDKLGFTDEQFNAETDELKVESCGLKETTQGWHFANFRYRGTIYIERLPAGKLALLALLLRAWLDEFDDLRRKYNLDDPTVESIKLDDSYLDVLVQLNFVDEVYLAEVEDGDIEFNGKTYDVDEYPVNYAEQGTVNDAEV